ncbi:MAG: aminotransferase class I/II-fold pyridoxal phosphate-dependent enzyme [Eubacteriales bacterium]|nr:aminotransferase class I/II-fold pyridoxal phosphate-dependent enzyme [Eubacteriales bacterium]
MNMSDMIVPGVKAVPFSGIRKYFDLVNEMQGVISLGIGEPDFVTPWNIREAGIYSLEKGYTHYSSNAGYIELRNEIANYQSRRYGLSYDAREEILVTVGGSEAIDIALRSLVKEGDEVIIPEPSFVAYKGCTAFTGAKSVIVELKAEDDFRLKPEMLKAAITDRTKVLVIPFPNNPTGAIMEKSDLQAVADVIMDKDIIVISDEIYSELTYGAEHVSIASLKGMRDRTIVISGFSKAFAMTGWRIGYVCGSKIIIDQMKKIHQYAIMCSPTTAQFAAIEALKNSADDVSSMVREYNRRRRLMLSRLNSMGLSCFEPQGAFYTFPCIKSTGLSSDEFCEKLLMDEKVLMIPGNAFGECGEGFVRATYANSMENLLEALNRIERFLQKMKA